MEYITTKIKPRKSYPTYQFHAYTSAKPQNLDCVFKICILETFKWLKSRLSQYEILPADLLVPSPEEYDVFSLSQLHSFNLNMGFTIDVVNIEELGIWTIHISETDIGANLGTPKERQPVQGRTFDTEIAFHKLEKSVEVGVKTICSEPIDSQAPCEVFRPTVVKALAKNPNVGLQKQFPLCDTVLFISTKTDAERLNKMLSDKQSNFPIILETEEIIHPVITPPPVLNNAAPMLSCLSAVPASNVSYSIHADFSKIETQNPLHAKKKSRIKSTKTRVSSNPTFPIAEKTETLDCTSLAKSLLCFGFVFSIHKNCWKYINAKQSFTLKGGDFIVYAHGKVIEQHTYAELSNRWESYYRELKKEITAMPKHSSYDYGTVVFYSDARILEIREKKKQNISLDEKIELLLQENAELQKQMKEQTQINADKVYYSEELRNYKKKTKALDFQLEELAKKNKALQEQFDSLKNASSHSNQIISFYQSKVAIAAASPTSCKGIGAWIQDQFSDTLILTARANTELEKYTRPIQTTILCDGIFFLHGYAKMRQQKITPDELCLYAEQGKWEVQPCGKMALQCYKNEYTIQYQQKNYLLEQHIKYGVNSQQLMRIYFCWSEELQRIIIGHLPEHLPVLTY